MAIPTTGGPKLRRTLRTLRAIEPDVPIVLVYDWGHPHRDGYGSQADVGANADACGAEVVELALDPRPASPLSELHNAAMRAADAEWVALIHDDFVFNPAVTCVLSRWRWWLDNQGPERTAGGMLSFYGLFHQNVPNPWHIALDEGDRMDLESPVVWAALKAATAGARVYFPHRVPDARFRPVPGQPFSVLAAVVDRPRPWPMLAPISIVSRRAWERFPWEPAWSPWYDAQFPQDAIRDGLTFWALPAEPAIHVGTATRPADPPSCGSFADLAKARYGETFEAFADTFFTTEDCP